MRLSGNQQDDVALEATKLYFRHKLIYSIAGLIIGAITTCLGVLLFIMGILGGTTWTVKAFGLESNISDAPPGAVIAIVGLFVISFTKHKVSFQLDDNSHPKDGIRRNYRM